MSWAKNVSLHCDKLKIQEYLPRYFVKVVQKKKVSELVYVDCGTVVPRLLELSP